MMAYFTKKHIAFLAVLALSGSVCGLAFAENAKEAPNVIIKVDSDGLKAQIIATGKGDVSEKVDINSPQARLLAKRAAVADAYQNLLKAVDAISPDYFPKERYLIKDKVIKGATLVETRYYGNGNAEADVELDIALNNPIANKFEKDMRLLGYRVVEYDRPDTEITEEMP